MTNPRCVSCKHSYSNHNDFNNQTLDLGCDLCICARFVDIVVHVLTWFIYVMVGMFVFGCLCFYLWLWLAYKKGVLL